VKTAWRNGTVKAELLSGFPSQELTAAGQRCLTTPSSSLPVASKLTVEAYRSERDDRPVCDNTNLLTRYDTAYEFLRWIEYLQREKQSEAPKASELVSDLEIALRLWNAATAHHLNPRAVGTLRGLLTELRKNGFKWEEPEWWSRTVAHLERSSATES
jgi:hypothetical protein